MYDVKEMRLPDNHTEYEGDEIMSNFDKCIIYDTANEIMDKTLFSRYAGWNFNGKVWRIDNKWHCEVWVYGSPRETISCDTLEELMEKVSCKYGSE